MKTSTFAFATLLFMQIFSGFSVASNEFQNTSPVISEVGQSEDDSVSTGNLQATNPSTEKPSLAKGWAHTDFSKRDSLAPLDIIGFSRGHLSNHVAVVKTGDNNEANLDYRRDSQSGGIEVNYNKKPEQAAMIDAFQLTNKIHNYFADHLGIDALKQTLPITLVVNSKKIKCNAQFEEGHIYFSAQDKTCGNAVDPSTVFHEYTHYVDSIIGGMSEPDLAEGLADMTAAFITGNPTLTEVRNNKVVVVRSVENEIKFDYKKANSGDAKTQYRQSQAWSGFAWHSRLALIEKYGPTKGQQMAEDLFFSPLSLNIKTIPEAVENIFSQLNPNGSSKTVDYDLIKSAAQRHGFRVP